MFIFSKFKIEMLIGSLLLSTLALILANRFVLRSCELAPGGSESVTVTDDRVLGGTSKGFAEISDDLFRHHYVVDDANFKHTFSQIGIVPNEGFPTDLAWIDRFDIQIKSNKQAGEKVIFFVRDFVPGISSDKDDATLKCNETLLSVSNVMETITVKRNQFSVPAWWKKKFEDSELGYSSFNDVRLFEFSVSNAGEGIIEIASIRGFGNWVDAATLNQLLLWLWMSGILFAIVYRMLSLNEKLSEKTKNASQLLAHNNLLITKSDAYHELARRDPLTGLFNRYGLEGELEQNEGDFDYSMILFDLDKFKDINDNHGHLYGDRVLIDIAQIVRSQLGDEDLVGRWGGDEFLIMLRHRDEDQAVEFTREVRRAVSASDLSYTCSFGICKPIAGSSFESVFARADAALYESKSNGRNDVSVYQEIGEPQVPNLNTAESPRITPR